MGTRVGVNVGVLLGVGVRMGVIDTVGVVGSGGCVDGTGEAIVVLTEVTVSPGEVDTGGVTVQPVRAKKTVTKNIFMAKNDFPFIIFTTSSYQLPIAKSTV